MPDIKEILDEFIIQAGTDNLRTSHYSKEYSDLRMKVSFGQGVPARVPWIAIIAPEMQVHHGFYPVYLYFKALNKLILAYGISETVEFHMTWPEEGKENRSIITDYLTTEVPRYGDSYVFKAYAPEIAGNQVNYLDDESGKRLSPDDLDRELKQLINDYKKFVSIEIQDEDGKVVGSHTGFTDYTIGQRKGLKLSFPEPRYVKKINPITNTITIAKKRSMFSSKCMTNNINWMIPPPKIPIKAYSKIRYNSKGGNSLIEKNKDKYIISFDDPQLAITPGQSIVFYKDNTLLGGGIIEEFNEESSR